MDKLQQPGFAQTLHEQRELDYHYDHDGCLVLKARLPAEQGEVIVKALEHAMDRSVKDVDPEGTLEDKEPVAARRADALREMAESFLNHPENNGSTADRYQVVVHVRKDTPCAAHLDNGPCVSAETSERIACDCWVTRIEEDSTGEPLNIGRRSRTIPPPMRRALQARDASGSMKNRIPSQSRKRSPGCTGASRKIA